MKKKYHWAEDWYQKNNSLSPLNGAVYSLSEAWLVGFEYAKEMLLKENQKKPYYFDLEPARDFIRNLGDEDST